MVRILMVSLWMMLPLAASVEPILSNKPIHEAFVPKAAPLLPLPVSAMEPPAPIPENIPPQPEEDLIWIPGYWEWVEESNSYTWVCGVWRRPPPNMQWIPGAWVNQEGGWARLLGFWSSQPLASLAVIPQAPPELPQESPPPSPGDSYFYFKGYWDYSSGNYQYQAGSWQPFDEQWILAQPAYYWRPDGYRFTQAYWDLSLDDRGYAYDCESGNVQQYNVIEPQVIIQELYVYYPDYIPIYWHWWHFHPGFWDGCWCMPPWWGWGGWWGLGWHDHWGLWWWWGHPGFPAPMWLGAEFAHKIAPPHEKAIDFFKKAPPPFFVTPNGIPSSKDLLDHLDKPLLPKNPKQWEGIKDKIGDNLPKGPKERPEGKPGLKDLPPPKMPPKDKPERVTSPVKPLPVPPKPKLPPGGMKLPKKPEVTKPLPEKPQLPPKPQIDRIPDLPDRPQWNPPKPQMPDRPLVTPPRPQMPDRPSKQPDRPQITPPQFKQPDRPMMPPQDVTPSRPQFTPPTPPPQPSQPPQMDQGTVIKTFPTPENRSQGPSRQDIRERIEQRRLDRGKGSD
ncbi:MAG: hypothetical protein ACK5MA_00895 [Parachlamydiaceae bacterium]